MDSTYYTKLSQSSISEETLNHNECQSILTSQNIELLPLLDAAYRVRKRFKGNEVLIHIIDNVQNGSCSEDCRYCAQSKDSTAKISNYQMKSDDEIMDEAKNAYGKGAFRHCLVFSGHHTQKNRIAHIANIVRKIKAQYPMQVCVSAGIVDQESIKMLKDAGLDRLNHNLNTSERFYKNICTTHTFDDRVNTINAARSYGLEICSGVIVGMGEASRDVIDMALKLRELSVSSIPVNFLVPIEGNNLDSPNDLTPEYCLRVLCLFRFLNPRAEIRIAAGREVHLRNLEVMSLYPANSLFLDGYLNTKGSSSGRTLRMIKDAGFTIKSDHSLNDLVFKAGGAPEALNVNNDALVIKGLDDLRPNLQKFIKSRG